MGSELAKFRTSLDRGIDVYEPDLSSEFSYDEGTYNLTSGLALGVGPRYGMAPLPNHNHNESPTGTTGGVQTLPGLRRARQTSGTGCIYRKKVYGIAQLSMRPFGDYKAKNRPVYIYVVGLDRFSGKSSPDGYVLDVQLASELDRGSTSGPNVYRVSDLSYGIPSHVIDQAISISNGFSLPCLTHITKESTTVTSMVRIYDLLTLRCGKSTISDVPYVSFAVFTNVEKFIKNAWVYGIASAGASTTDAPPATFLWLGPLNINAPGYPEWVLTKRYDTSNHAFEVFGINALLGMEANYKYLNRYNDTMINGTTYDLTSIACTQRVDRLDAAPPVYADIAYSLVHDETMTRSCGYSAVLVAGSQPVAMIFQDWVRNSTSNSTNNGGLPHQIVDLVQQYPAPTDQLTQNETMTGLYTEGAIPVSTAWNSWPNFVRGTPLAASSASAFNGDIQVRLGAADSGVLRSNTVYEFSYALYDKSLDFETNVGTPAKIQTGSADLVAVTIYRDMKSGANFLQVAFTPSAPFLVFGTNDTYNLNNLEFRVYYREEGTNQWLPALIIDYAQLVWWPNKQELYMCTGPIAALPGGQPGGFSDYSPLQGGNYDCVLTFKNRAFWFGSKGLTFSLRNNVFCYPARNYQTVPTGELRGAMVHNYPGDAEQNSRLLVFGTDTVYVGRFTGQMLYSPVQVSIDTVEQYPLDGSDFVLDPWTSDTAFSYRAAVIAEGIAFWWGPGGIFRDGGVNTPERISLTLQPLIFDLYDPTRVDQIFGFFNDRTREIVWIYLKPGATTSSGILYNIDKGRFKFLEFNCVIDSASQIDAKYSSHDGTLVGGKRTIVSVRDGTSTLDQDAFFYDHLCKSGDMKPSACLLVKQVTASSNTRVLTLAAGAPSTGIAVGDAIAVYDALKYVSATSVLSPGTISDQIARVSAVNLPTSITIQIPDDATFATFSLSTTEPEQFLPVWHLAASGRGLNGIQWQMESNYWMPVDEDYSGIWQWLYLRSRLDYWASTLAQTFDISYRTPTSDPFITDTCEIVDNSDGHQQLYHPLRLDETNNQGQAFKFRVSGYHIGSPMTFEVAVLYGEEEQGNTLKQFEG